MVRVVGKDGAFGGGGIWSYAMDSEKGIMVTPTAW